MSGRREKSRRGAAAGFTLVEVMLALAILFAGLVVLIRSTASNIYTAQRAYMLGVATDLARGEMYDIEENLLRNGYQEMDQKVDGDFSDQGWPHITYEAKIVKIKLPDLAALKALQNHRGGDGGVPDQSGSDSSGDSGDSQGGLGGGLLGMLGGGMGMGNQKSNANSGRAQMGESILSMQYQMFREALEASIRKVTLTVNWHAGISDEKMNVVCYFTDPAAVTRVMAGGPAAAAAAAGGTGTGSTGTGSTGTGSTGTGGGLR